MSLLLSTIVCPDVPLFVYHAPSNCFFCSVSRWPPFLHVPLYKTLFFDFWFRPPNAQNLLPKMCTKSHITWLVSWQIDRRCLSLPGGFRGWPIQWNHAECYGPTLVAMATKFGLDAEIQSPTGLSPFLVVSTSATDCLERLVSEITYYASSGTLKSTTTTTTKISHPKIKIKLYWRHCRVWVLFKVSWSCVLCSAISNRFWRFWFQVQSQKLIF